VLRGSGRNVFRNSPYKIAGKTGTAKIAGKGGYTREYNASFVGYFPADRPKYSCIVVINKPSKGKYYGGSVAAPAFKEIADKLYSTMLAFEIEQLPDTGAPHRPERNAPSTYDELKTIYAALNIPVADYLHEEQWASANLVEEKLVFESEEFKESKVPDVRGMKARDAVYLLENMGMKTQLSGRGKVKSQSVKAGQEIKKGQQINLQLAAY
jgi:cell division protein FtsI (penicillin-binding protein 3)